MAARWLQLAESSSVVERLAVISLVMPSGQAQSSIL